MQLIIQIELMWQRLMVAAAEDLLFRKLKAFIYVECLIL